MKQFGSFRVNSSFTFFQRIAIIFCPKVRNFPSLRSKLPDSFDRTDPSGSINGKSKKGKPKEKMERSRKFRDFILRLSFDIYCIHQTFIWFDLVGKPLGQVAAWPYGHQYFKSTIKKIGESKTLLFLFNSFVDLDISRSARGGRDTRSDKQIIYQSTR